MKAIVLSYDYNQVFVENMIVQYAKLWPDNPFEYFVPYQMDQRLAQYKNVTYIKTEKSIKSTIERLLQEIPDDEWIYWSMDDKYPFWLDLNAMIEVYNSINYRFIPESFDSILLCRCKTLRNKNHVINKNPYILNKRKLLKRQTFTEIWLHQFIRAGVLKYIFSKIPDDLPNAKAMDKYVDELNLPGRYSLFVSKDTFIKFGESCSRGEATLNCYESMLSNDIVIPDGLSITHKKIFYGKISPIVENVLQNDVYLLIKGMVLKAIYLNAFYRPLYIKIKARITMHYLRRKTNKG